MKPEIMREFAEEELDILERKRAVEPDLGSRELSTYEDFEEWYDELGKRCANLPTTIHTTPSKYHTKQKMTVNVGLAEGSKFSDEPLLLTLSWRFDHGKGLGCLEAEWRSGFAGETWQESFRRGDLELLDMDQGSHRESLTKKLGLLNESVSAAEEALAAERAELM